MKRIYLLMILFVAIAAQSYGQTDLRLIHLNLKTGDTIRYTSKGERGRIVAWGFANDGPNALSQATDTILLKRAYTKGGGNVVRLSLPTGGLPVGDTVYYTDTVYFSTAAATQPWDWCDSIWARSSMVTISDPQLSNNEDCPKVYFKEYENAAIGDVDGDNNGIAIYPNPATSTVNVRYNFVNKADGRLLIKDLTGRTVHNQQLGANLSGEQVFNVDISSLASGMYIMELYANDDKMVSKFNVAK